MRTRAFMFAVITAIGAFVSGALDVYAQEIVRFGSYDSLGSASAVVSSGDYVFVADRGMPGLVIIDVSDPDTPTRAAEYRTSMGPFDVDVGYNTVFLAVGSSEPYSGALLIIDVTDVHNPAPLGTFNYSWEVMSVELNQNLDYAYITTADLPGFLIIDITNPANPTEVMRYGGMSAGDIFSRGAYLYIAKGTPGIEIVYVGNGADPQPRGSLDTPGIAYEISGLEYFSGIYVADGDSGIQAINVSDPEHPAIMGHMPAPGGGRATSVLDGHYYVYAVMADSGLAIINFSNPYYPELFRFVPTPDDPRGIVLAGGMTVLTAQSLEIYHQNPEGHGCYSRGNINGVPPVNGIDVVYGASYFKGGQPPPNVCAFCPLPHFYLAVDVNGNCVVNGLDLTYLVNFLKGQRYCLWHCPLCPPRDY